jgi:hypothetical protein
MKNEEKKQKDSTIYQTNENCQVFNGPISGCVFAMPGATVNQSPVQSVSLIKNLESDEVEHEKQNEEDDELVARLMPIFYNNETDVKTFLKEISGMKPNNITDLVNRWVQEKRISGYGNSRKGELWGILNDAGLYMKSRQNWCRRVY